MNIRIILITGLFLAACVTACISPSFGAEADDYFDLAPEQLLSAHVISVSKRMERAFDTPAAVYVITSEDIQRSGVTTIPEALRLAPGIFVAQTDSNSWIVTSRGFSYSLNNKLLVLMDGRTLYNPLFGGTYWEAQDYLLEDIDRIEVIRGPGGTIWGANAINGIINIITKSAAQTQGTLLSAAYGNHEQGQFGARHGGEFSPGGARYRLYAKEFNRSEFDRPASDIGANDSWMGGRTGFRVDWDRQLTISGDVYHTEAEKNEDKLSFTAPFETRQEEMIKYEGANLNGLWSKNFDDGAALTVQSYLDYSQRDEILLRDERIIFDLDVQHSFAAQGRHELIVGAGYRFVAQDNANTIAVSLTEPERKDQLYSMFLQDRIALVPAEWYLTLGSKFEHNSYSGFEAQPSARLQWFPDDTQTLWASVTHAVRTPSQLEQGVQYTISLRAGPVQTAVVPNEGFDSEQMEAYEAGYRKQVTPDLSVDLATFYNEYRDLGVFNVLAAQAVNNGIDPAHFLVPIQYVNDGHAETYGFELASDWRLDENLTLAASYSLINLQMHMPAGAIDPVSVEDLTPHHLAKFHASWDISDDWTLDGLLYYTDQVAAQDVPDYVRLDLNLGWAINDNVEFNLIGQNLFNDHREFDPANAINAADIGESVFGKFTVKF